MSEQDATVRMRLRYRGGDADQGLLDIYDGANSLFGFAKALQLSTHFFIHRDVIKHATSLRGAKIYIRPPERGSFVDQIELIITNHPIISAVGLSVISNAIYDFMKVALGRAVGAYYEPKTTYVTRLSTEFEPHLDELAEVLEGPMIDAHRTIQESGGTIVLERPRSELIKFDNSTLEYVNTREELPEETVYGTVTKYNALSGNGRFYDEKVGRTVSFKAPLAVMPQSNVSNISWSLHQYNDKKPSRMSFQVRRVVSARGDTKRLIVISTARA